LSFGQEREMVRREIREESLVYRLGIIMKFTTKIKIPSGANVIELFCP
jgi:hypothetical protein